MCNNRDTGAAANTQKKSLRSVMYVEKSLNIVYALKVMKRTKHYIIRNQVTNIQSLYENTKK